MSEPPRTGKPPQDQPPDTPQGQQPPPPPPPPPSGQAAYGQVPPQGAPYGQPPPPGQPYGQAPPPGAWAPQPMSPSDERTWGLFAHLGALIVLVISGGFLGWVPPLVIMMTKGKESFFVRHHAVESLNLQITLVIAFLVSVIVSIPLIFVVIGLFTIWLLPLAIGIVGLIFMIMASVAANKGEWYRYPVNIRLVK